MAHYFQLRTPRIKGELTAERALELLNDDGIGIKIRNLEDAKALDFQAKDLWQHGGDIGEAYECRVKAARIFENQSNFSAEKNSVLNDAALAYDRAARNAYWLSSQTGNNKTYRRNIIMAAIGCRMRACRLHYHLWKEGYKDDRDWRFASNDLINLLRSYNAS